jgi:hypothetical protein
MKTALAAAVVVVTIPTTIRIDGQWAAAVDVAFIAGESAGSVSTR